MGSRSFLVELAAAAIHQALIINVLPEDLAYMTATSLVIHTKAFGCPFEQIVRANQTGNLNKQQRRVGCSPPTGGTSGRKNRNLTGQFSNWVEQNLDLGEALIPNFQLELNTTPDASWVRRCWDALANNSKIAIHLVPDFL